MILRSRRAASAGRPRGCRLLAGPRQPTPHSHGLPCRRGAAAFYSSNHTRDWQGWPDAINTTFDLPRLYQLANRSDVQFGDYNRTGNCTHPYDRDEVNARKGVLDVCFRQAPQLLPRIGEVQIAAATAPAEPAVSSVGAWPTHDVLSRAGGAGAGSCRCAN